MFRFKKRSTNVPSRNELGRLSLNLQITMDIFKFWIHLENQLPDSITKLCLNISDKMAEENKSGLINKINLLCTQLNINKQSVNFKNPSVFLSKAENNLSKPPAKFDKNKGNYNLKIETGRFTIPKTPEELRICDHCNLNSVENEMHILFHCDVYNDLRKTLFIKINDRNTFLQITRLPPYSYGRDIVNICFIMAFLGIWKHSLM